MTHCSETTLAVMLFMGVGTDMRVERPSTPGDESPGCERCPINGAKAVSGRGRLNITQARAYGVKSSDAPEATESNSERCGLATLVSTTHLRLRVLSKKSSP